MQPFTAVALLAALFCFTCSAAATPTDASTPIEVTTPLGVLQGSCDSAVCTFLGVPYAQPPLGALRFKPPQPPNPWDGVHSATTQPPSCWQTETVYGPFSEDCLYVNVFVPVAAVTTNRTMNLPVMFWLYGGSFISGGINLFLYQGNVIAAQQNVIVVAANYRLGIMGWAVNDELSRENDGWPTSGNYALLDQRLALFWVQASISSFGGNPQQVMLFGESAGAISTCFQIVSSLETPFARALLESGPCTQGAIHPKSTWSYDTVKQRTTVAMNAVNCNDVACLRAQDAQHLVQASADNWGPVIDGLLIPDDPVTLFQNGKYNTQIELVLGSNTDEGTLYVAALTSSLFSSHSLSFCG
jgi:carboxylesterase type B